MGLVYSGVGASQHLFSRLGEGLQKLLPLSRFALAPLSQFAQGWEPVWLGAPHGKMQTGLLGYVGRVFGQTGGIEAHCDVQRGGVVTTAGRYRVKPRHPFLALVQRGPCHC